MKARLCPAKELLPLMFFDWGVVQDMPAGDPRHYGFQSRFAKTETSVGSMPQKQRNHKADDGQIQWDEQSYHPL